MAEQELIHYGTKRHSGRYPYGSGENPYQHEGWFRWGSANGPIKYESEIYKKIKELNAAGINKETDIAAALGMSTTELRRKKALAKEEIEAQQRADITELKDAGFSNRAIAEKVFGDPKKESRVRYILKPVVEERQKVTDNIAEILKNSVDNQKYIDVGAGTELYLGNVSKEKLNNAIEKLKGEGYKVQMLKVEQAGNPGKYTYIKVLTKDDVPYKELLANQDKVGFPGEGFYTNDGGKTFLGIEKPESLDSSRLMIRYNEEGGKEMDGVIQIRRGVDDISLGGANYAQVRIAVDGTHYLKGMAIYSDDMPPGVDIIFNTNKHEGTPALGADKNNSVLKPMKTDKDGNIDWANPFGTTLRMEDGKIVGQRHYTDENGDEQLSLINIVRQEGDWNTWSNTLASQFLAKQPLALITQQLNLTREMKVNEYDAIMQITQPEVRKDQLLQFANQCDASASELKAAKLPRQASKVILPVPDIDEKEIYAPTYEPGEQVALIRYPHAGKFEIPVLTVNNNVKSAKKMITGYSIDAVGISPKTAEQLSGADFDGDTVVVIPIKNQKIDYRPVLEGLKNFEPKEEYKAVPGMKVMTKRGTQTEMGKISNLIADMTLKGATDDELVRAVKHSMVVIDAEKHKLNYKLSEEVNQIAELKKKYQGSENAGASTLITKANKEVRVDLRKQDKVNKETGEKIHETDERNLYYPKPKKNQEGEITGWTEGKRSTKTTMMAEVKDARELIEGVGTPVENLYAEYANAMKSMANNARKEAYSTPATKVNKSAKETYAEEVSSLNAKLNIALRNAPKERKAQAVANSRFKDKKKENPDMTNDERKKYQTQLLAAARNEFGANKRDASIKLTDKEWDAIMAGAFSSSKISQIISNTPKDRIKQLAMPRDNNKLTRTQINEIKARYANGEGYSEKDIAEIMQISQTTVWNVLNGKGDYSE